MAGTGDCYSCNCVSPSRGYKTARETTLAKRYYMEVVNGLPVIYSLAQCKSNIENQQVSTPMKRGLKEKGVLMDLREY